MAMQGSTFKLISGSMYHWRGNAWIDGGQQLNDHHWNDGVPPLE